jgi:hypothetical protein
MSAFCRSGETTTRLLGSVENSSLCIFVQLSSSLFAYRILAEVLKSGLAKPGGVLKC